MITITFNVSVIWSKLIGPYNYISYKVIGRLLLSIKLITNRFVRMHYFKNILKFIFIVIFLEIGIKELKSIKLI